LVEFGTSELSLNATDIQLRGRRLRLVSIPKHPFGTTIAGGGGAWQNEPDESTSSRNNELYHADCLAHRDDENCGQQSGVDDQSKESETEDLQEALVFEKKTGWRISFVNAYRDCHFETK
jgi:hypothetical protein